MSPFIHALATPQLEHAPNIILCHAVKHTNPRSFATHCTSLSFRSCKTWTSYSNVAFFESTISYFLLGVVPRLNVFCLRRREEGRNRAIVEIESVCFFSTKTDSTYWNMQNFQTHAAFYNWFLPTNPSDQPWKPCLHSISRFPAQIWIHSVLVRPYGTYCFFNQYYW